MEFNSGFKGLISQVHLPSFVKMLPKYLKDSTFSSCFFGTTKASVYKSQSCCMKCVLKFANFGRLLWMQTCQILGAFAQLRKATISIIMPVRPPAWNNSVPTRRIFMKFGISLFFEKCAEKSQVTLTLKSPN